MDLVRLNPTTYQPTHLLENWKSLIWTRRQIGMSEFELISYDIRKTQQILQKGSYVSLLDDREVMRVESVVLDRNEKGEAYTKLKGRSMKSILERRWAILNFTTLPPKPFHWAAITEHEVLNWLIQHYLITGGLTSAEAIPNISVQYEAGLWGTPTYQRIPNENVLTIFERYQKQGYLGCDTLRPATPSGSGLTFYIYKGGGISSVQFRQDSGDIESFNTLYSDVGEKNVAYIFHKDGGYRIGNMHAGSTGLETGMNRRVLYVDGSDIGEYTTGTGGSFGDLMLARGSEALWEEGWGTQESQIVVSPGSQYKYGVDYKMGSIVGIQTGFSDNATIGQVTEYIRTEDENGERGYPSLTVLGF